MNDTQLNLLKDQTVLQLKNRRTALNLTQQQLAEKCGYQRETIARIEAGKFFISTKQLYIIADALGLDINLMPK